MKIIQRIVSSVETFMRIDECTATRPDGFGGTETFSYIVRTPEQRIVQKIEQVQVCEPPPPPPLPPARPPESALIDEAIGDGSTGCLEHAYEAAGPEDGVTLLVDERDATGHAVVERADGTVHDPATGADHDSMDAYLESNPRYALPDDPAARSIPRATLDEVFAAPPGSAARAAVLGERGLSGVAELVVADPPETGPLTAEEALEIVSGLLESSTFNDVTHGDLMEIEATLRRIPAGEVNDVIAGLTDEQLDQWVTDINDGGWFGYRGLNDEERGDLFDFLGGHLRGDQAGRLIGALGDHPAQMQQLGAALLEGGDPNLSLELVFALGQESFTDEQRGATARLLAGALQNLTSSPEQLALAVRYMSQQNLQDAIIATGCPGWDFMGPFGGQLEFDCLDEVAELVDAVAGTEHHEARADVFEALGYTIRDVIRTDAPVLFEEEVVDAFMGHMTSLLGDDTVAVVGALSGDDGADPTGRALSTWVEEQIKDGGPELSTLIAPFEELDLTAPGPSGRYDDGFLAGYVTGAVFHALDDLSPADLLGPDVGFFMELANLVVSFRTDPATELLLQGAIDEAERRGIEAAMREGSDALKVALLDLLGVELSPANDNGTALGAFEQGLFATYGADLYALQD